MFVHSIWTLIRSQICPTWMSIPTARNWLHSPWWTFGLVGWFTQPLELTQWHDFSHGDRTHNGALYRVTVGVARPLHDHYTESYTYVLRVSSSGTSLGELSHDHSLVGGWRSGQPSRSWRPGQKVVAKAAGAGGSWWWGHEPWLVAPLAKMRWQRFITIHDVNGWINGWMVEWLRMLNTWLLISQPMMASDSEWSLMMVHGGSEPTTVGILVGKWWLKQWPLMMLCNYSPSMTWLDIVSIVVNSGG